MQTAGDLRPQHQHHEVVPAVLRAVRARVSAIAAPRGPRIHHKRVPRENRRHPELQKNRKHRALHRPVSGQARVF